MRDNATTLLDFLGVLALSGGITGGLWPLIGAWALCAGGLLLLVASGLSARGPKVGDKA